MVLKATKLEQKKPLPPQTRTWIQGNFPRSWSQGDVPFRRCQKICWRVNAGNQSHCEHTSWMFLSWEVGGWISEGIRPTAWLENGTFFWWKTFMSFPTAERNTQTIFQWKMETIFRWKMYIFRTPRWRLLWCTRPTLKMREIGPANLKRAGSLKTPNTLCNRSVSFAAWILANFPWLIAWIPLLPWFPGNFRVQWDLGEFGKFRENSVEFIGIQWGFLWRLVWIQWEFLGDFGATPDFRENWGFGVVSGDLGGQKAFAQIANFPEYFPEKRVMLLEGPTRKPRHASVFNTHSDTQARFRF